MLNFPPRWATEVPYLSRAAAFNWLTIQGILCEQLNPCRCKEKGSESKGQRGSLKQFARALGFDREDAWHGDIVRDSQGGGDGVGI